MGKKNGTSVHQGVPGQVVNLSGLLISVASTQLPGVWLVTVHVLEHSGPGPPPVGALRGRCWWSERSSRSGSCRLNACVTEFPMALCLKTTGALWDYNASFFPFQRESNTSSLGFCEHLRFYVFCESQTPCM